MLRFAIIPFFLVFTLVTSSFAEMKQKQMVSTSAQILKVFNQDYSGSKDSRTLPKRFKRDRIKAVAIIPDLVKVGAVATALGGEGLFCIKNPDGTWSDPLFIQIRGIGLGAQAGYISHDAVLLFDNTRSYSGLFDGEHTISIGSDASLLGGRSYNNKTDVTELGANILALGRSDGIFVGLSFEDAKISTHDQNNIDYYGRIYRYEDILNGSPRDTKYTKMLKDALRNTFNR